MKLCSEKRFPFVAYSSMGMPSVPPSIPWLCLHIESSFSVCRQRLYGEEESTLIRLVFSPCLLMQACLYGMFL